MDRGNVLHINDINKLKEKYSELAQYSEEIELLLLELSGAPTTPETLRQRIVKKVAAKPLLWEDR